MDASMDVLPFSLSCDRCSFRTKSMSAMRVHADTHHTAPVATESGMSESHVTIGSTSGDNDALQALVDSALRDASGLLLSPQSNSRHHGEMPSLSRGLVEEDQRGDDGGRRMDMRCIADQSRMMATTLQHHETNTLVAEDVLGIYAAGIDLSVVGGGTEDGHFVHGPGRVEGSNGDGRGTVNSHSIDSGESGEQSSAGGSFDRTENQSFYCNADKDAVTHRDKIEMNSGTAHNERAAGTVSAIKQSGETQKSKMGAVTRPLFRFVIHPSAFLKTQPLESNVHCASPTESSTVAKHTKSHMKDNSVLVKALSPSPPSSTEGAGRSLTRLDVVTTALRKRGLRKRSTVQVDRKEVEEGPVLGRRRGRKPACPIKVILPPPQRKPRSRIRAGGRTSARPSRNEWKKTRHKCTECSFSCMFKKDLAAHNKSTHVRQARLGKVSFGIGNRRVSRSRVCDEGTKRGRRTSKRGMISPRAVLRDTNEKITPKRRGRPRTGSGKRIVGGVTPDRRERRILRQERKGNEQSIPDENCVVANITSDVSDGDNDISQSDEEEKDDARMVEADNDDSICQICQKFVAMSPADMKQHIAAMHSATTRASMKQFKCNFCDYSCQFRKTLATHIHDSHSDKDLAKLQELQSLPRLKRRKDPLHVDPNRVYRCNMCEFSCHGSHLLNSHMKSKHNFEKMSGEFKCDKCGKVIVGRYSHFRRHLRTHTDERPFKCDECPLAFRDINSLNCHKPIHKENRDYLCEECGMAFKRPINLRMHRKVHSDKSFACEECDYRCRRRNTLINHKKRKHLKQKSVLCQHCGHCFFSKTECKNHVLKKHTPRPTPFACPVCPQVFMFQYRFRAHLKTHREIKPYKCSYCGFETRLNTYLMDHMRQHTGEKPKKCDQCDYTTSTNSNLYKHRKRHHGPAGAIPVRSPRLRKSRSRGLAKDGATVPPNGTEVKNPSEKSVVEELVNSVEFGHLPTQVITSSSMFGMSPMCSSTHDLKPEQIMQVPPVDVQVQHGIPLMTGEVNVLSGPGADVPHEADRLALSDKSSSSVAAMMEALAEARNMRQPTHQHTITHHNSYPIHLVQASQATGMAVNTTTTNPVAQAILPRTSTNMTMHYSHPNIGGGNHSAIGGANHSAAMQAAHYHHLSALAGDTATRSPIASHGQPPPHNTVIGPPLLGVGPVSTPPPPLGHFPNMMHF